MDIHPDAPDTEMIDAGITTRSVIRIVVGTTVAMLACCYNAHVVDCEITCTQATGCPTGFTCSEAEGLCRSGETSASCDAVLDGGVDTGVDTEIDGGLVCPAGFDSAHHLFVNMTVDWTAAAAFCRSLDTITTDNSYVHLVVISDADELAQLPVPSGQVCNNNTELCEPWFGYTDRKLAPATCPDPVSCAVSFKWITDEPGFVMWGTGQPDDGTAPRCGYRDSNSDLLMHDRTCVGHDRQIMCECDAFPENPQHF